VNYAIPDVTIWMRGQRQHEIDTTWITQMAEGNRNRLQNIRIRLFRQCLREKVEAIFREWLFARAQLRKDIDSSLTLADVCTSNKRSSRIENFTRTSKLQSPD